MDLGVFIHCAKLLRGGTVGATWPWIQPHLGLTPHVGGAPLLDPLAATTEGPHAWATTC
jgi:hypothetical protein